MAAGCGSSEEAPGEEPLANPGFVRPGSSPDARWDQAITWAYSEDNDVFTDLGPADWSCLNTPSGLQPSTASITISGVLEDFQTSKEITEAEISVFAETKDINGAGLDTTVTDEDGNYSVTVAAGVDSVAFRVIARGQMDTYSLNEKINPDSPEQEVDVGSVSLLTANALPAFIGVTRTAGLGILAGTVEDCNGNQVGGAVATVSDVSGSPEHLEGAATYYFSAEPGNSLPVRHNLAANTREDGIFTVIELQSSPSAYLQVWGFMEGQDPEVDDMTLLAEVPAPILSDSVVISTMQPLQQ
jgi:hypothetical protein